MYYGPERVCATAVRLQAVTTLAYTTLYQSRHANFYVAAKATYIRLLYGKRGFFGPSSVKRGRTHTVLG